METVYIENSDLSKQGCPGTDPAKGPDESFEDPVIGELREIRHRLAARFGNDLGKVAEDLMERQTIHGPRLLERPPMN